MNLPDWLKQKHGRTIELAQMIGRSGPTVSEWSTGKKRVPADVCPDVEVATGGAVTCEEMRPDVKWHVLRGARPLPGGARAANAPASDGAVEVLMHPEACAASNDSADFQPGRA